MSSPKPSFSLAPVVPADVAVLSEVSGLAFENDRNTMLKAAHPTKPYNHGGGMLEAFEYWFSLPQGKVELTKAVDDETGEILGFVCWAMRLNKPGSIPVREKGTQDVSAAGEDGSLKLAKDNVKLPDRIISQDHVKQNSPNIDPLAQLNELSSSHLAEYQRRVMPEGTRCMYMVSINVHPKHQGRGVGSALIRQGTNRADVEGVFCWVHSSEAGAAMLRKCGFKIDETLELDLDKWASMMDIEPPDGDDKWGKYTFRYMVRQPKPA